jgi:Lamin Tail Domain
MRRSMSAPKIALIATALAGGLLVATVDVRQAEATPNRARDCTGCHGSGSVTGSVSATPSTTTPAAGATYTVRITTPANPNGGATGYWIANSDAGGATGTSTGVTGGPSSAATYTATMKAPATVGTHYYKAWVVKGSDSPSGRTNFALYQITVGAPAPTPAATLRFSRIYYDAPGTDRKTNRSLNAEWFAVKNYGSAKRSLTGLTVKDRQGNVYRFARGSLAAGATVKVHTGAGKATTRNRFWGARKHVWGNSSDRARLLNGGQLLDSCSWSKRGTGQTAC